MVVRVRARRHDLARGETFACRSKRRPGGRVTAPAARNRHQRDHRNDRQQATWAPALPSPLGWRAQAASASAKTLTCACADSELRSILLKGDIPEHSGRRPLYLGVCSPDRWRRSLRICRVPPSDQAIAAGIHAIELPRREPPSPTVMTIERQCPYSRMESRRNLSFAARESVHSRAHRSNDGHSDFCSTARKRIEPAHRTSLLPFQRLPQLAPSRAARRSRPRAFWDRMVRDDVRPKVPASGLEDTRQTTVLLTASLVVRSPSSSRRLPLAMASRPRA